MLPLGPGVNDILALLRAVWGTDTDVITGWYGNSEKKIIENYCFMKYIL